MSAYAVGVDFGTLSARALVVDMADGRELADCESIYPHAVMTDTLPDGTPLKPAWAVQHPQDYVDCLCAAVRGAVAASGVSPEEIRAVGLDFTSDTSLPVDADGQALCLQPEFASEPNAWVKLWKHHGAQKEADEIRRIAEEMGCGFLERYGGQVSAEWMVPRLLECCRQAPDLFRAADRFLEMGDWITFLLTGSTAHSLSYAGFKAFHGEEGWPEQAFWQRLHPLLGERAAWLLRGELLPPGAKAGELDARGAGMLGLPEGVTVAVANTDALTPMPALGLTEAGDLLMSIGTSTCHTLVSPELKPFPGICGAVKDGIIPGLYGYESGQSCTGDHFAWAAKNIVPESYTKRAREMGVNVQQLLTEEAAALRPGQSGLLALDWWNGVRSLLMDMDLSGVLLGMTLKTTAPEIYRALIEATAYATRLIVESYEAHGLPVRRVYACGGITKKNPLVMQIYADVLGRDIYVADSAQTAALGSAVLAAAACGSTVKEAAGRMRCGASVVWHPQAEEHRVYDRLYAEYVKLHDYFGRGGNDVMKHLSAIARGEI